MTQLNVLVSGAGIAGSVVAYWLGKAGIKVTVLERAPKLRTSGQGIDIRGQGLNIMRKMGVDDEIQACTTKEAGMVFVDEGNKNLLTLDVSGDKGFTAEIEIIRSDLAKILYDATLSTSVKYEFDVCITGLSQTSSGVSVDLSNGQTRSYDLVIAADGFGSRTRRLILGPEKSKAGLKSLDSFVTYFTMPLEQQDQPCSRWFTTYGRRAALLRPKSHDKTSAYLTFFSNSQAARDVQSSSDIEVQKAYIREAFKSVGWEVPRILKAMQNVGSDDFYMQEVGQIKLDPSSWHQGRCALLGDAAYCPSGFTGMGTTLAIIGAYVLAGEIAAQVKQTPTSSGGTEAPDFEAAFRNYESLLGPYVKDIQKMPLGGRLPFLLNPETVWGVWILRTILWFVSWSGLLKLFSFLSVPKTEGIELPEYDF